MNKIVIIGIYIGKFPEHMDLWLKSCKYNKNIDFMIFTDNVMESKIPNVKFIKFSLEEFSKLASKKLQLDINVKRPYKCCDFKAVYGIIFEDYIKEYNFWGHCDFDLIFGDIRAFITDEMLEKYDKILPLGHLSLYRNTKEVNERYKCQGYLGKNYKEIFTTEGSYAFDEFPGMYSIYKNNQFPFYDKRVFADITIKHIRFTLGGRDKNYKNQVFYWENGKIYRAYEKDGKIISEEFVYIHFQKRKGMNVHINNIEKCNSFFVTNTGFYTKQQKETTKEDTNKYNKYRGWFCETMENINYHFNRNKKRVIHKLKEVLRFEWTNNKKFNN